MNTDQLGGFDLLGWNLHRPGRVCKHRVCSSTIKKQFWRCSIWLLNLDFERSLTDLRYRILGTEGIIQKHWQHKQALINLWMGNNRLCETLTTLSVINSSLAIWLLSGSIQSMAVPGEKTMNKHILQIIFKPHWKQSQKQSTFLYIQIKQYKRKVPS